MYRAAAEASRPFIPSVLLHPRRYPFSRLRWQLYKICFGDMDSHCGVFIRYLEITLVLLFLAAFIVSSLPIYRERSKGVYENPNASRVLFATDLVVTSVFSVLLLVRLLCVTAVPGREEFEGLLAEVRLENMLEGRALLPKKGNGLGVKILAGSGGATQFYQGSDHQGKEEGEGDEGEEEEEEEEEAVVHAAFFGNSIMERPSEYNPTRASEVGAAQYAAGGLRRSAQRLLYFLLLPSTLIDIFSVLPFYLDIALGTPDYLVLLRVTRFIRALRLLRTTVETLPFRLVRRSLRSFVGVFWTVLPTIAVMLTMFSCAIYMCEKGTWYDVSPVPGEGPGFFRPNVSGAALEATPFESVIHTLWFVLVTLSTLGYGDMVPTSPAGKLVTSFAVFTGIVIIAVPATLVGWNFSNEYSNHIARVKEREKASKRLAKSGLLGKSFAGKSFVQPQEDIRGYVKEAVEEATAGLRAEIKALLVKLEGKK